MEQQEEKKGKNYGRRRRRQSKSTSSFAIDLTSEILLRLLLKSGVRFLCMSKLWSSIINDPYFINLLETRSQRSTLLVCIRKDNSLFVSSILQHSKNSNKSYSSSQPIDRYHVKLPGKYSHLPPSGYAHGLICFQDSGKPIVWKPSMTRFLNLTSPSESWGHIRMLLGYDPVEGKHKLLCIPAYPQTCSKCGVLTLGSAQESWRTVRTNHEHLAYMSTPWQCIKGVVYYLPYVGNDCVIMSFDVRSEKFDMIQLPSDIHPNKLITYEGTLALVKNKGCPSGITLWILQDAEKYKWSRKDFLAPFYHHDRSLKTSYDLRGITHAGEFIYVPLSVSRESFYILFCDPVRNSWRRIEFQGIANNESGPHKYRIYAFPNHTESLLSL